MKTEKPCEKCGGRGWVYVGNGEDRQCDCKLTEPPAPTPKEASDTPRCDAFLTSLKYDICEVDSPSDECRDFMRQLERENAALVKSLKEMTEEAKEHIDYGFCLQIIEEAEAAIRSATGGVTK